MSKQNQIKKVVNGEIADADDVNQIVENAGNEGGAIPYDPTTHTRDEDGNEAIGSSNYPWGDIFVNKEAYLKEIVTGSASISSSVKFDNLRKIIYTKDLFTTTPNSWTGHAGQFLRVRVTEDGIEPSAPTSIHVFTSNGTFNVPSGITKVYLTMIGGGGGGGGGGAAANAGGGGSGGAMVINRPYTVTPSTGYSVTVGAGGTGGANQNVDGGTGGTSSFDALSVVGGNGGFASSGTGDGGSAVGGFDASGATSGGDSLKGGSGGNRSSGTSGAGGGTLFGSGGAGKSSGTGNSGSANTGAGGGGGGGASNVAGGDGGSGIVIVMF